MALLKDVSLKNLNTFGLDVKAENLIEISSASELSQSISTLTNANLLVLGGGSNVLFMNNFSGNVLLNRVKGIEVLDENENFIWVKSGAGVVWHEFVLHCNEKNWAGIENLALIPGSVGAAPMQNIGAYGVEVKSVFHELEAVEIATGDIKVFSNAECEFGYRESIFKRKLKGQFIITSVTFKLHKKPDFQTSYGAIISELERLKVTDLSISAISNAVINIRKSKLPDPAKIGNAGSFFKNPIVPLAVVKAIRNEYPNCASYPVNDEFSKLAAGWLIDQAGWKGKRFGNYGVHDKQALVLVNYGGATGQEIYDLSTEIVEDIRLKFGVKLEREVNIIS